MKLNFDFAFMALNGEVVKDGNAGKVLASHVASGNKGNSIKLWDWALRMYNHQDIELDNTDFDVLYALISENETLNVMAKAQLLNYMNDAKKKS